MKKKPKKKTKTATKKTPSKARPPRGAKHFVEYVALGGHSDSYKCICGWKSNGYWDLVEAAWDEWLLHAHDTGTEIRPKDFDRQAKVIAARDKHLNTLKANRDNLNVQIARLEPK